MTWTFRLLRVVAVVLVGGLAAAWLAGVGALAQTVETPLHEMADAAGVIFAGQVVRVRGVDGGGAASGVVEVEFRVDQAVRGCAAGGSYVLREWAGLWAGGERRYRVGQRLLMLLHAPNAAGLSSPVGGLDGAIPIRGVESELAGASAGLGPTVARPVEMVDLRWVGTKVVKPVSYAAAAERGSGPSGVRVWAKTAGVGGGSSVVSAAGVTGGVSSVASEGASVGVVMEMLGGWERARAQR